MGAPKEQTGAALALARQAADFTFLLAPPLLGLLYDGVRREDKVVKDCLGSELATGQRCRLCCRLLGPLPTLNSAAEIRELHIKRTIMDLPQRTPNALPSRCRLTSKPV